LNGKEVVERALSLGEAVHGSEKEKAILKLIEGSLDREVKRVPVRTKVWEVKEFHVRVNGREWLPSTTAVIAENSLRS